MRGRMQPHGPQAHRCVQLAAGVGVHVNAHRPSGTRMRIHQPPRERPWRPLPCAHVPPHGRIHMHAAPAASSAHARSTCARACRFPPSRYPTDPGATPYDSEGIATIQGAARQRTSPHACAARARCSCSQQCRLRRAHASDSNHRCPTADAVSQARGGGLARAGRQQPCPRSAFHQPRALLAPAPAAPLPSLSPPGDLLLLAAGDCRQMGRAVSVCPDALLDDGLLDFTIAMGRLAERVRAACAALAVHAARHVPRAQAAVCRMRSQVVPPGVP